MSEIFHIGYPWNPYSLPFINSVCRTLELISLHALPCPVPSGWVGSFKERNLYAWYLGELVHPQQSRGGLTLPVAFIVASSATLMYNAAVSQLLLSEKVWLVNEGCF